MDYIRLILAFDPFLVAYVAAVLLLTGYLARRLLARPRPDRRKGSDALL